MINLLPIKEKRELKLYVLKHNIVTVGAFLIGIVLFFILFFATVWLILYHSQNRIQTTNDLFAQAQALEKQVNNLNKELSGFINQRLEYINQLQKEQIVWSIILAKIAQMTPNSIRFDLVEINNDKIQISGYAETRDDVANFQKILEQEPQFIEVYSPLSNFVKQKDINFVFSFKIKK